MAHRDTFPTGQYDRLAGVSVGVDPQKERRASAPNWCWEVIFMSRSATDGHRNGAVVHHRSKRECTSENEIKVSNALELVLWGIAIEPRATLAGSSRTGPTSQRPLYREQGVVDGGPAL